MKKGLLLLAGAIILLLLVVGTAMRFNKKPAVVTGEPAAQAPAATDCRNFSQARLTVGDKELTVALAQTHAERSQGLSGCTAIPDNSGMLFVFPQLSNTAFWMKDMLIPLDIIWIKEGKVIGIEANAQPPQPGTADRDLPQYPSPDSVDHVLELSAGKAGEYDITEGSSVTF